MQQDVPEVTNLPPPLEGGQDTISETSPPPLEGGQDTTSETSPPPLEGGQDTTSETSPPPLEGGQDAATSETSPPPLKGGRILHLRLHHHHSRGDRIFQLHRHLRRYICTCMCMQVYTCVYVSSCYCSCMYMPSTVEGTCIIMYHPVIVCNFQNPC